MDTSSGRFSDPSKGDGDSSRAPGDGEGGPSGGSPPPPPPLFEMPAVAGPRPAREFGDSVPSTEPPPPLPTHGGLPRIHGGGDPYWNGWEWRWDRPGELLGDVPWPFVVVPRTVIWARRLCLIQGALAILLCIVLALLLIVVTQDNPVANDEHTSLAVLIAVQTGLAGFVLFFGGGLRSMSRGLLWLVTVIETGQTASALFYAVSAHRPMVLVSTIIPLLVITLLWADSGTRYAFSIAERELASTAGPVRVRVVQPRKVRDLVPEEPPGPPLWAPPARPQRYR